ncbi:uncharacterized protein LOC133819058 [Humulus lupulus]|uniref:uncharacterized protein LOC133819058 n=1 Tax=Humulus lupulus TaxID=3486 RepID=UPI002B40BC71|nr:uncharacterized protein LOC133819058 [Humulus lupulus]
MYHSFLTQRSKINWIKKGDMNTSFSYAYLKQRRADNGIVSFINDQGNLVDNFSEVVSHFVEHFRGYLGSPSSATGSINMDCLDLGPKLSMDHQTMLLKPFSYKEIRNALFGFPITKSPSPDGYGSGFFKAAWQVVGNEVCSAISQCLETGLALVLPAIIQPNQGAFIRGRSIAHNIMIFQDLIKNYGRAVTSPRCAIKIDLSKAYDTVDWQFLEDLLKALCFPMKFIGWIMVCLRNTSYSLLMNGRVQGTHSAVLTLKEIVEGFSSATSLAINTAKSQIFFGGVSAAERKIIAQEVHLPEGSFPLKYLGSIVKEIEKLCRSFLWGSSGMRSKPYLASWQKVCLPKAYGGLGFRDGALWNIAILAKYIWAISEQPEILWVKWVNTIYLKGFNFWSYTLKSDCSWYWRKLCHIREKFGYSEIQAAGCLGRFQPSKLYNCALNQQLVGYYHAVWSKLNLPKHRFLLWQVINEQLLTRDNLIRLHIQVPILLCPVCGSYSENHHHLFFACSLSK